MKTMRIVPAVGAILLFAAAAHAEPQAMNDSDLARIVGGESHSNTMFGPSGGVINTGDSNVDISEGGNVAQFPMPVYSPQNKGGPTER